MSQSQLYPKDQKKELKQWKKDLQKQNKEAQKYDKDMQKNYAKTEKELGYNPALAGAPMIAPVAPIGASGLLTGPALSTSSNLVNPTAGPFETNVINPPGAYVGSFEPNIPPGKLLTAEEHPGFQTGFCPNTCATGYPTTCTTGYPTTCTTGAPLLTTGAPVLTSTAPYQVTGAPVMRTAPVFPVGPNTVVSKTAPLVIPVVHPVIETTPVIETAPIITKQTTVVQDAFIKEEPRIIREEATYIRNEPVIIKEEVRVITEAPVLATGGVYTGPPLDPLLLKNSGLKSEFPTDSTMRYH